MGNTLPFEIDGFPKSYLISISIYVKISGKKKYFGKPARKKENHIIFIHVYNTT